MSDPHKLAGTQAARHDTRASAAGDSQHKRMQETPRKPVPKPPLRGTAENDAAVDALYPRVGDSVIIDVDAVQWTQRTDHHQFLLDHGMHGRIGVVVGTEVYGGIYMLIVETGTQRVHVDARCCLAHALPEQAQQQHEPRTSPEKMRKPSRGSYNLT